MILVIACSAGRLPAADEPPVRTAAVVQQPVVVPAEEPAMETREFTMSIDGTPRGVCTMQMVRRADGSESVQMSASLRINYLVYRYRYSSIGTEFWKDGRLTELQNTADYNGAKYGLVARSDGASVQGSVNGKNFFTDGDVWVTSYWQIPMRLTGPVGEEGGNVIRRTSSQSSVGARPIRLLDSDQGKLLNGRLKWVGEETMIFAGRRQACTHYRITGDVQVELWYDSARRLVCQESVESGHKTRLDLARIDIR